MTPREALRRVKRLEIRTRKLVDESLAGSYHSVFRGRGMEFAEVRQYEPGDDVRTIDWNDSARMGHPFVKKYSEERELTVVLLVDVSGSVRFGTADATKLQAAAEIAALLAFSAIRNNDRVGLLLFTEAHLGVTATSSPGLFRPRPGRTTRTSSPGPSSRRTPRPCWSNWGPGTRTRTGSATERRP